MDINCSSYETDLEKIEQIERGKRIKNIRENELHMNKTQLANEIGISSQFLGLIEDGKGNLVYKSLKKLRDLSGHSADFILYGLDDDIIEKTKKCLEAFSDHEISNAIKIIKDIAFFIKDK